MDSFEFYIKKIKLENYRKYTEQIFELESDMTVFVGKNAAGKTSVLESVCVLLGAYLAAYKKYVASRHVFNISQNDVRIDFRNEIVKDIMLNNGEAQYPCRVSCDFQFGNREIYYKRSLEKAGSRTKFDGSNPMQKTVTEWEEKSKEKKDAHIVLPLVLYLSSSRLWDEGNQKGNQVETPPSRYEGYSRCLDPRRGMQLCRDYLRTLALIAAQENEGKDYPSRIVITQAVNRAFSEELPEGDVIEHSVRFGDFVQRKKDGSWIPYSQLSDGYRNVIRIVSEIATRMCILNPHLKEHTLENTPGVVVIDELDLSLHPTWQRRIVKILKMLFPRVQFICATHSPFIIQSLDERELISLDQDVTLDYSRSGIEDISEDIMGVDMPYYSKEHEELYKTTEEFFSLIKEASSESDIEAIREKLGILTSRYNGDPALCALLKQEYNAKINDMRK